MTIFLREATNAKNLRTLLPLVNAANQHRFCLCTDDRQPADLLDDGHIDHLVRLAIAGGVDPIVRAPHGELEHRAPLPASTTAARSRPGRRADLVVFDDLRAPRPRLVFRRGQLVARDGEPLVAAPKRAPHLRAHDERRLERDRPRDLRRGPQRGPRARHRRDSRTSSSSRHLVEPARIENGRAVADPSRDLLKMAVIERHSRFGRHRQGIRARLRARDEGALASSVAHDHHNLVVIGADDPSMTTAARRAAALGGGLVVAAGERVLAEVPLPLGGLMSDRPIEEVRAALDRALVAAGELGSTLHDPFMAMSFLALEVIPSLKLTDRGLVDVDRFELVPLWVG